MPARRPRLAAWLGLAAGFAAVIALVAWRGAAPVAEALAVLGWGVLLLPVVHLPSLALAASSWRLLFRVRQAPSWRTAAAATWIGNSVATLLPVTGLGGEAVKARLVAIRGVGAGDAAASVVAGQAVQALSLALWALIGAALLAAHAGDRGLLVAVVVGAVAIAAGTVGFVAVQRAGLVGKLVAAITGRRGERITRAARRVDAALRRIYRRPGRVAGAVAFHLGARVALTIEVWLAAQLMGVPLTLLEATMVKSLTGTVRGVLFVVPAGLGAQEAAYVALAAVVDTSPAAMLAISLATRGREMLIAAPGLFAWHRAEARALRAGAAG